MQLYADRLTVKRGAQLLFCNLSFSLDPGNLLTVTGPNGAGKSTLLRVIAGLHEPQSGQVCIEEGGQQLPPALYSHYLSDRNAMKPGLSVSDNLHFWSSWSKEPALAPFKALEAVEMAHCMHLPFGMLSTGQKRRVALARLLVFRRPLWLLDEPTSGLDSTAVALFSTIMKRHLHSGGMIVAATHLPLGIASAAAVKLHEERP